MESRPEARLRKAAVHAGLPGALTALCMLSTACPAPAPQPSPSSSPGSSLWSNPELELAAQDGIDASLDRPLPDVFEITDRSSNQTRRVRTCREFLKAREERLEPRSDLELRVWRREGATCRVLEMLRHAHPYSKACVSYEAPASTFLDRLSAAMAPVVSSDEEARRSAAAAAGQSLKQFRPDLKVLSDRPPLIELESPDWKISLKWMIRADLDGDGQEDGVLIQINELTGSTLEQTSVVTLSCDENGGRLRVVRDAPP